MRQNTYVITMYKFGSKVTFPPDSLHFDLHNAGKRGRIGSCSKRALIRGAFTLANAPKDWGAMVTLTHRLFPTDVKQAFRKFLRRFRLTFGREVQWSWFMEFQKKGRVHFHFFIEREWLERMNFLHNLELVKRKKRNEPSLLIRGDLERWIVDTWISCTGDESPACRRFNEGGIVEMLRNADGAGRYMARYVGKESQKTLPKGCAPAGRWWEINPLYRPQPLGYCVAKHWPFPFKYKFVYDSKMLDELVCEPRANLKLPPTDEEKGVIPFEKDAIEERDGKWTFVSYTHPELDLDVTNKRKKVK